MGRLQVVTGKAMRSGDRNVSRGRWKGQAGVEVCSWARCAPGCCSVPGMAHAGMGTPARTAMNLRILPRAPALAPTGAQRWQQSAQSKQQTRGSCSSRLRHRRLPPLTLHPGFASELPATRAFPRPLDEFSAFCPHINNVNPSQPLRGGCTHRHLFLPRWLPKD